MPAISRPNAPHLPSEDFKDLFQRPHASRGSETRPTILTPSPLSTPPNWLRQRRTLGSSEAGLAPSSPLASPPSPFPPRRPIYVERQTGSSETSNKTESAQQDKNPLAGPIYESFEEEDVPRRKRAYSSGSTQAGQTFGTYELRSSQSFRNEDHNEASDDAHWKREFLGGRIQIRLRRKSDGALPGANGESSDSSRQTKGWSTESTAQSMRQEPTSHITSYSTRSGTLVNECSSNANSQQTLFGETPDETNNPPSTPKEGLYCRTRRVLGLKRDALDVNGYEFRSRTPTANVLDRVASTLRLANVRRDTSDSAATSMSNLSVAAPRGHRLRFRKNYSTSSSIREFMMSKPPIATPEPEAMYTGSDSRQYITVELGELDAPTFLPSEARRVNTPPLPSSSPSKSAPRGFFFDYSAPTAEDSARMHKIRSETSGRAGSVSETEWYRVKMNAIDNETFLSRQEYVASVPDHLPNSPLCPRHPRHKSGGTGDCPIHGTNKPMPTRKDGNEKPPTPLRDETWW
ncbi:accessory factor associated with RNA polymerase II [Puttea exsequens]|nr:accessory factor associated with RNA polymerase II [Puttea exsequens]